MPSKLPLMDILLQSIKYLAQNMRLTGCFFVISTGNVRERMP